MRRLLAVMLISVLIVSSLTGCQGKKPEPGDIAGYDEGEEYLSIWVHSIEDTDEGRCYVGRGAHHLVDRAEIKLSFCRLDQLPIGRYKHRIVAMVHSYLHHLSNIVGR